MPKSCSISQAQHNLTRLLQQLEHHSRIELTHRGKPVAMLLSLAEVNRLSAKAQNFWAAYSAFAAAVDLPRLKIDPQVFEAVRDQAGGGEINR
jgi:prevent-host-death family protein